MLDKNALQVALRSFSFREKVAIWFVVIVVTLALGYWARAMYLYFTVPMPAPGGKYVEGMVGQPTYINPLFPQTESVNSAITELVYDGLLRYGPEGKLESNMAEKWDVEEDGKKYTFHLKKNILWHDGKPLTVDDVLFTYGLIQDPAYESPLFFEWQGVGMDKIDEYTFSLSLKETSFDFLDNLTVGILPKHIWENIGAERIILSKYNLEPIGSGPYRYVDVQKDENGNILAYNLKAFGSFYGNVPYIKTFSIQFYPDQMSLLDAYERREILGTGDITIEGISRVEYTEKDVNIHTIEIPHFYGVFFNQNQSVPLAYEEVRKALVMAVDRDVLVKNALSGYGRETESLFLPGTAGFREYDSKALIEEAQALLEENGWEMSDEEGEEDVRKKSDTLLEFTLYTTKDGLFGAEEAAHELQNQWAKIGARVHVEIVDGYDLGKNYIQPREYDALLYAHVTSIESDPYVSWHSDYKKDTGRNFAIFDDKNADDLLEQARKTLDAQKRDEIYKDWQKILDKKNHAVYLFNPYYIYLIDPKVQGMNMGRIAYPSDRFSQVEYWFIKTKRVFHKD